MLSASCCVELQPVNCARFARRGPGAKARAPPASVAVWGETAARREETMLPAVRKWNTSDAPIVYLLWPVLVKS